MPEEKIPKEVARPLFAAIALHALISKSTHENDAPKKAVEVADKLIKELDL